MSLTKYLRNGDVEKSGEVMQLVMTGPGYMESVAVKGFNPKIDVYASAEALVQASSTHEAVEIDPDVFWVHDMQRFEAKPVLSRLPSGKRTEVAKNTESGKLLASMANDPDIYVRYAVAKNKATPQVARDVLFKEGLADTYKNPNTSIEVLDLLARDIDPLTRAVASSHENTSPATLHLLAQDPIDYVRQNVAQNSNTMPETLFQLAGDSDDFVRRHLARNAKTPATGLAVLAGDPSERTRYLVAENVNTPVNTLISLASDPDKDVAEAAKANPNYHQSTKKARKKKP